MSRDLRTLEGRLSAAEREAATARAGVTVPRLAYEDEPKEAGPENVAEQPITRMGVRLPYDGGIPKPILIRPNVHYYPASASLSTEPEDVTDDVSNKDKDYKDETAQYPPPAESPPQSPPSDYREDEQIAPLLSLDDSESSFQANARPPLSPKPRAASQQIPLSQLPVSKAKTKSEFIYLEINISDSQKQSIRIDTDSQPLVSLVFVVLQQLIC